MSDPASAPTDPVDPESAPQEEKKEDDMKTAEKKEAELPEIPPESLSTVSQGLYEIWRQENATEEVVKWFLKADVDVRTIKDLATTVLPGKDHKETEHAFREEVLQHIRLKIHLENGRKLKKGQPTTRGLDEHEANAVTAAFFRALQIHSKQSKSVISSSELEPAYCDLSRTEWLGDVPIRDNRYPQGSSDTMAFKVDAWRPADVKKKEEEADEEAHHHDSTQATGRKDRPAVDSLSEWKRVDDEKKSTALSEKTEPLTRTMEPENNPYCGGVQRSIDADCNRIDSIVAYGKAAHPQGIASDAIDWGKRMLGFGSSQSAPHNPNQQAGKTHTMEDLKQNDIFYIDDWKALDSIAALDALDRSSAHKSIFEDRIQMDSRHKQWEKDREKSEREIKKQAETPEEGLEACRFASVDYESLQRWKCGIEAPAGFA